MSGYWHSHWIRCSCPYMVQIIEWKFLLLMCFGINEKMVLLKTRCSRKYFLELWWRPRKFLECCILNHFSLASWGLKQPPDLGHKSTSGGARTRFSSPFFSQYFCSFFFNSSKWWLREETTVPYNITWSFIWVDSTI